MRTFKITTCYSSRFIAQVCFMVILRLWRPKRPAPICLYYYTIHIFNYRSRMVALVEVFRLLKQTRVESRG